MKRKFLIPFGETSGQSIDYLLGIIEDARMTTLLYTRDISTEELHWQYAPGWNTIGALLSHITSAGHYFRIHFIEGKEWTASEEKEFLPGMEMGKYLPQLITNEPIAVYQERLAIARNLLEDAIRRLSVEKFHERRDGYNKETGCNLAWVLYHLAEDEVHHRGQISLIRKLYKHKLGKQS